MNVAQYIIIAILIAAVVLAAYNLGRYHGARAAIEVFTEAMEAITETENGLSNKTEDAKDEKI